MKQHEQLISRFLAEGTLVFVNEAYWLLFRQEKRSELLGHSFIPLLIRSDQSKMRVDINSLSRENPIAIHDYRFLRNNG